MANKAALRLNMCQRGSRPQNSALPLCERMPLRLSMFQMNLKPRNSALQP